MIVAAWCLAMVIQFEGKTEPTLSQMAIADVVMARANWQPKKVCREAFRPWQFTALMSVRDVPPDSNKTWKRSKRIALMVLKCGKKCDVSKGADHYYKTGMHQTKDFKMVSGVPWWASSCAVTASLGTQTYCKERRSQSSRHTYIAAVKHHPPHSLFRTTPETGMPLLPRCKRASCIADLFSTPLNHFAAPSSPASPICIVAVLGFSRRRWHII